MDFLRQMGLYFVVTILGDQSENQVRVLSTVTGADSQAYAESVAALDWVQEPVFDSAVRAAFAVEGGAVFECYDDPADNSCGGGGGGGDCFSADDTINVQGRGIVAMKDLAVGDTVMVAPSKFERVYAFGHFNPAEKFKKFIQIHYSSPEKKGHIEMTNNHLLYIEKESHTWTAVKAGDVKVGDVIRVLGSELISGQVTKVFFSINDGVYMPLTESGDIIVNGRH